MGSEMCIRDRYREVFCDQFFAIFINDIDDCVKYSKILKYADDIRIYRCFMSDLLSQNENTDYFQSDINSIQSWSETWDLNFNTSKCCVLHFQAAQMLGLRIKSKILVCC